MDATTAAWVARRAHADQLSRSREPMIDHVERVARGVPADARAVAYVHDVLERSTWTVGDLRAHGLTEAELRVLKLLSRGPDESYEAHVMRIASARGPSGQMARAIKLADLDDHLARRIVAGSPDYTWARAQIAAVVIREHSAAATGRPNVRAAA
jgi:hypothetical protein